MDTVYARDTIAEMQGLTREYASYSRSRGGLANVLGGVIGLVIFGAVWIFGGTPATAALTVGLTSVWLVGKDIIRRRLYRGFGEAREGWADQSRRTHQALMWIFTPLLLAFAVWIVAAGWLSRPAVSLPYLVFCLATPLITWRLLYTLNDITIGFGLLFMSAVTASGHTPALLGLAFVPVYAAVLIPLGLTEHRQFKGLRTRLQGRRGAGV